MPEIAVEHDIVYESLAGKDFQELAPYLKKAGWTVAYPHLAEPIVARRGGEIIGFAIAQLVPHSEPLWVAPIWRGSGVAEELARRVVEKITSTGAQRFCCVAQNQWAEELCKANGMREVPGKLFVKEP